MAPLFVASEGSQTLTRGRVYKRDEIPAGTRHAYRLGDGQTLCGEPLTTLATFGEREPPVLWSAIDPDACFRCWDVAHHEAGA